MLELLQSILRTQARRGLPLAIRAMARAEGGAVSSRVSRRAVQPSALPRQYHHTPVVTSGAAPGGSSTRLLRRLGAAGAGFATALTLLSSHEPSRVREPLVDIEAIKRSFEHLSDELARQELSDTENKEKVQDFSLAINEAIHNSNLSDFTEMYTALLEVVGEPSLEYKTQLIHHLAQSAKVSFLRKLCTRYGMSELVYENELAVKVMTHPDADHIEAIASKQFWPGPGSIRADGARAFLVEQEEGDLAFVESHDTPDVYGLDTVDDMSVLIKFLSEQQEYRADVKRMYKNTAVLPIDDSVSLNRYARLLRSACEKSTGKTTFPFILTGAHFAYGQVEIQRFEDGRFELKSLYVDSLGASVGTDPGAWLVASLMHVFPEDTKMTHYVAENKIQHSETGCSVFVLNDFQVMLHADEVLPNLPQYRDELPKRGSLWRYMELYGPQEETGEVHIFAGDEEVACRDYNYRIATMPFAYSRQKQSLNRSGVIPGFSLSRLREQGYKYPGHEYTAVGHMGILRELSVSERRRQLEMRQPYRHDSDETPEQYLASHVKPNARGKQQNQSREDIYRWGHKLVSWLLAKPVGFSHQLRGAYDLDSFARKHGVATEAAPPPVKKDGAPVELEVSVNP